MKGNNDYIEVFLQLMYMTPADEGCPQYLYINKMPLSVEAVLHQHIYQTTKRLKQWIYLEKDSNVIRKTYCS